MLTFLNFHWLNQNFLPTGYFLNGAKTDPSMYCDKAGLLCLKSYAMQQARSLLYYNWAGKRNRIIPMQPAESFGMNYAVTPAIRSKILVLYMSTMWNVGVADSLPEERDCSRRRSVRMGGGSQRFKWK